MSRTPVIALLAILSVASPAVLAAQSSLAEAARKEAARRKEVRGTARVITNKDLPNVPPGTVAAPDTTTTAATPAPDAGAAAPGTPAVKPSPTAQEDGKTGKQDEKYWRDRIDAARKKVAESQAAADAFQSQINALTTDFVNRDDPAQRAVIANTRGAALASLEGYRQAVIDGARAIADIEEEARRAGVPPGWLR